MVTDHQTNNSGIDQNHEIVTFKQSTILFQNVNIKMIMVRSLTSVVQYEKLKLENHFYEMLTATVSHDMRTPLNAIIGLLNNMVFYVNDERGKKFLDIISFSSKILLFLVNDMLDFFQIRNGKFVKHEHAVNIKTTIHNLLDIFRVGAEEKGIQLFFNPDDTVPDHIITDEQRVSQVLINLI